MITTTTSRYPEEVKYALSNDGVVGFNTYLSNLKVEYLYSFLIMPLGKYREIVFPTDGAIIWRIWNKLCRTKRRGESINCPELIVFNSENAFPDFQEFSEIFKKCDCGGIGIFENDAGERAVLIAKPDECAVVVDTIDETLLRQEPRAVHKEKIMDSILQQMEKTKNKHQDEMIALY